MTEGNASARKPSRQQMRAQAREKRDAMGWITALGIDEPALRQRVQTALGNRHATRDDLEEILGISLASVAPAAAAAPAAAPTEARAEPERITLQHILISFAGAGTAATRSREEASDLAAATLQRALQGEDFAALVEEVTDDSAPGIYRLANTGVAPEGAGEYPRGRMVGAFGNVGFGLEVGGIGMADHDRATSPYGWHIIKRLA